MVGKTIAAAAQNFTKVQLEMGSKNALAVMDDDPILFAFDSQAHWPPLGVSST